jgi:hypothetical protein
VLHRAYLAVARNGYINVQMIECRFPVCSVHVFKLVLYHRFRRASADCRPTYANSGRSVEAFGRLTPYSSISDRTEHGEKRGGWKPFTRAVVWRREDVQRNSTNARPRLYFGQLRLKHLTTKCPGSMVEIVDIIYRSSSPVIDDTALLASNSMP